MAAGTGSAKQQGILESLAERPREAGMARLIPRGLSPGVLRQFAEIIAEGTGFLQKGGGRSLKV